MKRRANVSEEEKKIISATRNEWKSDRRKHKAIQKRAERVLLPDGRWKTLIRCNHCQELFRHEDIEANHINPVGPLKSTDPKDVADYRTRMFCHENDIEPLCKPCHRASTAAHRNNPRKEPKCTSESPDTAPLSTTTN